MAAKANFSKINALIVDSDHYSTGILCQILRGFGLSQCRVVDTIAQAREILSKGNIDLVICEASMPDEQPGEFIRWLRRLPQGPTKYTPIVMLTGYTQMSNVVGARDAGVNSVVRKPVSPKTLFDHIARAAAQERNFVETDHFIGPDRRFKFTGPPEGVGRRDGDLSAEIGDATEPNLTQDELNSTFKPTRVAIE